MAILTALILDAAARHPAPNDVHAPLGPARFRAGQFVPGIPRFDPANHIGVRHARRTQLRLVERLLDTRDLPGIDVEKSRDPLTRELALLRFRTRVNAASLESSSRDNRNVIAVPFGITHPVANQQAARCTTTTGAVLSPAGGARGDMTI